MNVEVSFSTLATTQAAKEKALQEKESYQRQMSMSRGGSRRGGDRGGDFSQVGPDGWAVAGSSRPPRPPPKAGDHSNFDKINKTTPMTFGPSSVFAGKKDGDKRETLSRTNSSSNIFSLLQNSEDTANDTSSRKTSIDLSPGVPEQPQRKEIFLPTPCDTSQGG